MTDWRWIDTAVVYAIHDRQLAEHGGREGIRDPNGVEAALAEPRQLHSYGSPNAADLAAAYAYGLVCNHGFADGNKRTAWVVARLFLADNGYRLKFDPIDAIRITESLAAGTIEEHPLAHWFRKRLT
jgi:death-on-curing protein